MFKALNLVPAEKKLASASDWSIFGNLKLFDQTEFIEKDTYSSLDNSGMIFTPHACTSGLKSCQLHVALHGCGMGMNYDVGFLQGWMYGDNFALFTGYLQYAANHEIIVLLP
jgi:hypothetical protein